MQNIIIVNDGTEMATVLNVKHYIQMRLRKHFDKINCQFVANEHNTIVFHVKTKKKIFESIKNELDVLYPGLCTYLQQKEEA